MIYIYIYTHVATYLYIHTYTYSIKFMRVNTYTMFLCVYGDRLQSISLARALLSFSCSLLLSLSKSWRLCLHSSPNQQVSKLAGLYTCAHIQTYIQTHTCIHTLSLSFKHIRTHTRAHAHSYAHTHAHAHTHPPARTIFYTQGSKL